MPSSHSLETSAAPIRHPSHSWHVFFLSCYVCLIYPEAGGEGGGEGRTVLYIYFLFYHICLISRLSNCYLFCSSFLRVFCLLML